MVDLPPAVEPYERGMLDAGDGQRLYWEECGDPAGKPAVVLHGGPGSGCAPWMRLLFDPAAYRVVLFDQRGCGRSLPSAGDPAADLAVNTTAHLLADIERLREHLRHRALARARRVVGEHARARLRAAAPRARVGGRAVMAVTNTRTRRGRLDHPRRRPLPAARVGGHSATACPRPSATANLAAAYARLLASTRRRRPRAGRARLVRLGGGARLARSGRGCRRRASPTRTFRFAFARVVTHYFANAALLEEGQLLRDAHRLAGIPGVLIHGRLDLGGPLEIAWQLHRAWPGSELVVLDGSGHVSVDMGRAAAEAIHRFARAGRGARRGACYNSAMASSPVRAGQPARRSRCRRPSLGGRAHRLRAAGRARALHDPPRRRLDAAVRHAEPRPADRGRPRRRRRQPRAARGPRRDPARAHAAGAAGPRRRRAARGRAARPRRAARRGRRAGHGARRRRGGRRDRGLPAGRARRPRGRRDAPRRLARARRRRPRRGRPGAARARRQRRIRAAIGPGAGVCCYEAGARGPCRVARTAAGAPGRARRPQARRAPPARAAGVAEVHDVGLCTLCAPPELLFSHRRDGGDTGRQAGVVWRSWPS